MSAYLQSFRGISLMLSLLTLVACATAPEGPWVEIKNQRFVIEIADEGPEQVRGLMFREQLADGTGMLFIFPFASPQAFWMRNTKIPLDIMYFDAQRKLVNVQRRVPPCLSENCPTYPSSAPAQYVLEINAGVADKLGFKPGDELIIHQ